MDSLDGARLMSFFACGTNFGSRKSYSPEIPAGASLGANLASVMSKSREIIQDVFDLQKPMPGSWVRSAFWTRHKSEIDKPTLVCSFCV